MTITYQKFLPGNYVMLMKNGKIVKEGLGLAVWYNRKKTNILQLPATAYDVPFSYDDLITADYQTACAQGQITYRIRDFRQAAGMADFSYRHKGPDTIQPAMELFGRRVAGLAKVLLMKEIGKKGIRDIIKSGEELAGQIQEMLVQHKETNDLGIEILAVNILCITAKAETRKALEAAAREKILGEQDDAIYKRRNAAIEQKRLIKENELTTEIRVIEMEKERTDKEQDVKRQLMTAELDMKKERTRREMEIRSAKLDGDLEIQERETAGQLKIREQELQEQTRLEKMKREYVVMEAANEDIRAKQRAEAVSAMVKAYENVNVALIEACALAQMDPGTLMAKAFLEMGENAGKIGTLNLTPDLLDAITARCAAVPAKVAAK